MAYKNLFPSVFLGFAFAFIGAAAADDDIHYGQSFRDFTPPVSGQCGLKSFSVSQYDQGFAGTTSEAIESGRGTEIATVVETTDASCIHDYAVVQYIRGCAYDIEQDDRTGKFERYFGTVIEDPNGNSIPFKFDDWTIDSVDLDPMYFSAPAKWRRDPRRFDGQLYAKRPLRLDGTPYGLDADRKTFFDSIFHGFAKELPIHPKQLFSYDVPVMATAYAYPNGRNAVTNVSLEFRVCVYASNDVPLRAKPTSPIHCFEWESRNGYDFAAKRFVSVPTIDPFCSTPVPPGKRPGRHPPHPATRTESFVR